MTEPQRILVVRLGAMGDIIHAMPAVASLKQAFASAKLAWAVDQRWTPLLSGNPFVDEAIAGSWWSIRGALKRRKFDLAVDLQGLLKSALVASASGAKQIYGFHRSAARESLAALFYSHCTKPQAVHVVDRYLEVAASAGARAAVRSFSIPQGEPEGTLPDRPFVLANPLAGWGAKQWPLENYVELGRKLASAGYALLLNVPNALHVAGDALVHVSGLPGLIWATRRAAAVVGVDSGPLHLAAALQKPGVAIFGPTDPARNGPYGGTIRVLRAAGAETTYKRHAEVAGAMRAIGVDDVWEALRPQLPQ